MSTNNVAQALLRPRGALAPYSNGLDPAQRTQVAVRYPNLLKALAAVRPRGTDPARDVWPEIVERVVGAAWSWPIDRRASEWNESISLMRRSVLRAHGIEDTLSMPEAKGPRGALSRRGSHWVQGHPTGARLTLAPSTESRALAAAVSRMVASLKPTEASTCTCGDCLSCELGVMRSRRAARHV